MKRRYIFVGVIFALLNIIIAVVITVFPTYYRYTNVTDPTAVYCFWTKVLGIYCMTCGFTRALWELMNFNIIASLKYNPAVGCIAASVIYYYARGMFVLTAKRNKEIRPIRYDIFPLLLCFDVMLVFCIVRNVMLLGFGIDFTGDIAARLT